MMPHTSLRRRRGDSSDRHRHHRRHRRGRGGCCCCCCYRCGRCFHRFLSVSIDIRPVACDGIGDGPPTAKASLFLFAA